MGRSWRSACTILDGQPLEDTGVLEEISNHTRVCSRNAVSVGSWMTRTFETSVSWTNAPWCSTGLWQKSRYFRRSGVVATVTRSASGKMTTPVPLQHFKRTRFLPCLTEHLVAAGESK